MIDCSLINDITHRKTTACVIGHVAAMAVVKYKVGAFRRAQWAFTPFKR